MFHLQDGTFFVNGMLTNGEWFEVGGTTAGPFNLTTQFNTTKCQTGSVLTWSPRPYPFGAFNCSRKFKKIDAFCLTDLAFGN